MNTQLYYFMSLHSSETFRTVAQMCHCEAVELFVALGDTPCFPSHAFSIWWAYNRYRHHKSLSPFAVWHGVLACWWKAFTRHFAWFTCGKEHSSHSPSLSKTVLLCLNPKPRESHTIFHTDFSIIQLSAMSVWWPAQINSVLLVRTWSVRSRTVPSSLWEGDGFVLLE